jgi:UDP-3-O-acyl-N-acetylglucosamine deacetylase
MLGNIVAKCAGHDINNKFLWELFSDDSNYQIIEENSVSSIEEIKFAVA